MAKHAFGTLTETLAQKLLPVVGRVATAGTKAVNWLTEHQTVGKIVIGVLAGLAVGILAVNAALLLNPASLVIAGLVGLGVAVVAAYRKFEGFRTVVNAVGAFMRDQVLPVLRAFGRYLTGTVAPAAAQTARRVGTALRPVLVQIAKTVRNDVVPAVRVVVAKFKEWWPTIRRVVEVIGRLTGKALELSARISGKVLPPIIRFAGFLIRTLVPAGVQTASIFVRMVGRVVDFARRVVGAIQAVARFVQAVRQKIGEAVTTIAGLPGKALSALGDLSTRLLQTGRQLVDGLISGVREKAGEIAGAARDVVEGAIDAARGALRIGSPSKVFHLIGVQTMQGLVLGIRKGSPGVERIVDRLTKNLSKKALRSLRDEFRALEGNARAQDRVNRRLGAALTRLKALRQASAQYAAGIRDAVVASGSVISLGEGTGFGSFQQLTDGLAERVRRAQEYARVLKRLAALKLNSTTLQQLVEAGVEGGLGTAQTLLAGGQAGIHQVNQMTAQLGQAGRGLGDAMANRFHGAGIRAAQGLIRGLRDRQKDLDRIARRLAATLVNAVRRALKIKSPSRVFADLGRKTVMGLTIGLDARPVKRAGLRLADALSGGFGAPDLTAMAGGAGGGTVVNVNVNVPPTANPVEVGRRIQKALDAYLSQGGRRAS